MKVIGDVLQWLFYMDDRLTKFQMYLLDAPLASFSNILIESFTLLICSVKCVSLKASGSLPMFRIRLFSSLNFPR